MVMARRALWKSDRKGEGGRKGGRWVGWWKGGREVGGVGRSSQKKNWVQGWWDPKNKCPGKK
jgi:hypothetical protein